MQVFFFFPLTIVRAGGVSYLKEIQVMKYFFEIASSFVRVMAGKNIEK